MIQMKNDWHIRVGSGGDYSCEANKVTIQSRVSFDQNETKFKGGGKIGITIGTSC